MALVANHTIVFVVSAFGIIKNPEATGQVIVSAFAEMGPVTAAHMVSQSYVDGAQAKSPYYAPPGQSYPPPQPVVIPPTVTSVTIAPAPAPTLITDGVHVDLSDVH